MSDTNTVTMIGRLSKPVELKYTQSGKAVTSFDLAVNGRPKAQGEKPETYWVPVVAWQKTAEILAQYGEKGQQICVAGRLQTRSFETQDGQKRKVMEVVADNIQLLAKSGGAAQGNARGNSSEVDVDEIPF